MPANFCLGIMGWAAVEFDKAPGQVKDHNQCTSSRWVLQPRRLAAEIASGSRSENVAPSRAPARNRAANARGVVRAQPPISVERADTEVRRIGDMLPFQPRNRQESESPHHRTSTIATLLTPLQAR